MAKSRRPDDGSDGRVFEARPPKDAPDAEDGRWLDEGPVVARAPAAAARPQRRRRIGTIEAPELVGMVGARRAATLTTRLTDAAEAFANERFVEARRILRPIVTEVPASPSARELLGLTQYRLGSWKDAVQLLESVSALDGGSVTNHPVMADCYRAMGRHARVAELWGELRDASPSAELVTEGRIVAAGSLADQGRLSDALGVLAKGWSQPARPKGHHLRRGYALADLYERAGDLPRARALFGWIVQSDARFADAAERLAALS